MWTSMDPSYVQIGWIVTIIWSTFYAPAIFSVGAYSIVAVSMYIRPIPYITQMVSVPYLLKRLVYWIEILYKNEMIIVSLN